MREELLAFVRSEKNIAMEFVEWAKTFQGDIYLYGAGNYLPFAAGFMKRYGVPVKAVLDSKKSGEFFVSPGKGSHDGDIPIMKFSDFLQNRDPLRECFFVISAPSAEKSIRETIGRYFPQECVAAFEMELYLKYLPDVEEYRTYMLRHWAEASAFNDALSDEESRRTFENVVKGRITGDLSYFQRCYVPDQYYPADIVRLSKGEIMVELGAYDGETLRQFIRLCPGYGAAYCFEPDKKLLPVLEEIRREQAERGGAVHIIPKGAWSSSTVLRFSAAGTETGDNHVLGEQEETGYSIETIAVDEAVQEPVSYMKMDIEGSEMQALQGSEKQIIKNHPTLAVCVYHKSEDILEIWDYLRGLVPSYRFYLRHHMWSGSETVLYAISEDRTLRPE